MTRRASTPSAIAGSQPIATYTTCLASVTYNNSSQNPTAPPSRIVRFVVNDGALASNNGDKTVSVTPVNDLPELQPPTRSPTPPPATPSCTSPAPPCPASLLSPTPRASPTKAGPFTDPDPARWR